VQERRHVAAALYAALLVVAVLLRQRLGPEELALHQRRPVLRRRRSGQLVVVQRHDGRRRRRAHRHRAMAVLAGAEADHGPGRDAGELLHHGAEVGGVRVEQRDRRPPRRAGPAPRRLADPPALDPWCRARHHRRRRVAVAPGPVGRVPGAPVTHKLIASSWLPSYPSSYGSSVGDWVAEFFGRTGSAATYSGPGLATSQTGRGEPVGCAADGRDHPRRRLL
jgi:hypothetical protein